MSTTSSQQASSLEVPEVQRILRDLLGSAEMYPGMERYLYGEGMRKGSPQYELLEEVATRVESAKRVDLAQAVDALIELMRVEDPAISRLHAVDILGAIGRRDLDLVARRVSGPEWFITRNIVIVLAKTRNPEAYDVVLSVADHEDSRVRVEVVRAVAVLDFDRSIPFLVEGMADPAQLVRDAAFTQARAHPGPTVAAELAQAILEGRLTTRMSRRGVSLIAERSDPTSGAALRLIAASKSLRPAVRAAAREARQLILEGPAAA